jgi:hypothetical protein
MTNKDRELEERKNEKTSIAVYSAGIVSYVALAFFCLIDILRGIPAWDICCIFFVTSAVYSFMLCQYRNSQIHSRNFTFKIIAAIFCFIMYFIFK